MPQFCQEVPRILNVNQLSEWGSEFRRIPGTVYLFLGLAHKIGPCYLNGEDCKSGGGRHAAPYYTTRQQTAEDLFFR